MFSANDWEPESEFDDIPGPMALRALYMQPIGGIQRIQEQVLS